MSRPRPSPGPPPAPPSRRSPTTRDQYAPAPVFVALRGQKADGAAFAAQAIARGAIAVMAEAPAPPSVSVPWIHVRDARLSLAPLADRSFDSPSRRMPGRRRHRDQRQDHDQLLAGLGPRRRRPHRRCDGNRLVPRPGRTRGVSYHPGSAGRGTSLRSPRRRGSPMSRPSRHPTRSRFRMTYKCRSQSSHSISMMCSLESPKARASASESRW